LAFGALPQTTYFLGGEMGARGREGEGAREVGKRE